MTAVTSQSRPSPGPGPTLWLAVSAGTLAWLVAIAAAPWLAARGATGASRVLYAIFAPVCHQMPGRCFTLAGHPLAVCGRCLGIYAGFAAGLLLFPFLRGFSRPGLPPGRLFLLLTLPMALDGAAGVLGLWSSPIGLRFATGIVWGAVLPFYFVPGVADLFRARKERAAGRALALSGPKKIE